jgi:hypothetical protein
VLWLHDPVPDTTRYLRMLVEVPHHEQQEVQIRPASCC